MNITILDNVSTDGTSELIEKYRKIYPNIRHIVHNRNIGGNANIARAFEIAKAKYLWILCDDDFYNFKHFDEIKSAILSNQYDCILTEWKYLFTAIDYPFVINTLAFVPAGIYKTENITATVMCNIESNIMYSFPHLALGCSLLNNKKKFYVPKFRVIKQCANMEFTRGLNPEVHFRQRYVNLFSGYINSNQMILDKKLRKQCCDVLWIGKSFFYSMIAFWGTNKLYSYNITDVFLGLTNFQRLQFILAGIYLCLKNLPSKIFSIRNSSDRKHKIITVMGLKIKIKRDIKTNNA